MFRAIISPILRSTRLCLQLVVHCRPKHVEFIEIINKIVILASSLLFILLTQKEFSI